MRKVGFGRQRLFLWIPSRIPQLDNIVPHMVKENGTPSDLSLCFDLCLFYYYLIESQTSKTRSAFVSTESTMAKDCPSCSGGPFKGFCPFSLFLFTGTALSYVRYLQSKSSRASPKEPFRVVFVLGGPGAGKVGHQKRIHVHIKSICLKQNMV